MQRWGGWLAGRVDPRWLTVAVTVAAYALVAATFAGLVPVYPELSRSTVDALSHATAAINAVTIAAIAVGWWTIRRGRIRRHAIAMALATVTIAAFLALYLTRIGGGGQKELAGDPHVALEGAYLVMLFVHVVLSIVSVPLVVFALALAATVPVHRLGDTRHPSVGRIAAAAWLVSLLLGIGAYLVLNHVVGAQLAG